MRKYFMFVAFAITMAACSSDDGPAVSDATIHLRTDVVNGGGSKTRALNQDLQSTQIAYGQKVWVEFTTSMASPNQGDGTTAGLWNGQKATAVYTADGAGALSTTTMTKWPDVSSTSTETVDIKAWAPFDAAPSTSTVYSIKTDQSSDADYKASDYLYGERTGITKSDIASPILITFNHMMAKIIVNVSSTIPTVNVQNAKVVMGSSNFKTSYMIAANGSVDPQSSPLGDIKLTENLGSDGRCACIIVPQTVSGQLFQVTVGSTPYTYSLPDPTTKSFDAGKVYTYNVALRTDAELIVLNETITNWDSQTPEGVIAN